MALQCSDMDALVHLYIDRELRDIERTEVQQHLQTCEPCRRHLHSELAFVAGVRARLAPPRATRDLHLRVAQSLTTAAHPRNFRAWIAPVIASAAAIAACVLAFVMADPAPAQVDTSARHASPTIAMPVDQPQRLPSMIAAYALDPRSPRPVAHRTVRIAETLVHVGENRGLHMAFYTKNGVGFALVSGLGEQQLLDRVKAELNR